MATVTLTDAEEEAAKSLLTHVRKGIEDVSGGDPRSTFRVRRYIYIRLQYDERGTPVERKKLKVSKFDEQGGVCPVCGERFERMKGLNLHRLDAALGYTPENIRLIHDRCHRKQQEEKGYS